MDSETFISCQNDAISPSKFLSQEEIQNVNNSPNSCVSYEDMEPSFTVDLLSMMNNHATADTNRRRRSSVASRRSSLVKVKMNKIKKSLCKLTVPTKSSLDKQRSKAVDDSVLSSSLRQSTAVGGNLLTSRSLQVTKPVSPNLRINNRLKVAKKTVVSTEEQEYNKLMKEKLEEEQRIKKFRAQYQSMKRGAKPAMTVMPSAKALTVPKTPESHVYKRQKAKRAEQGIPTPAAKKATMTNKPVAKPYVMPSRPTQVAPFKFAAKPCRSGDQTSPAKPVVLAAELAQKFIQNARSSYVPANAAQKLTIGQSPQFRIAKRGLQSKSKILSAAEREEQLMAQIQLKPFKARKVNRKIFDSMGELGVPKVAAKACTEPVGFELRSGQRTSVARGGVNKEAATVTAPTTVFKARPMPTFAVKEAPATPVVKSLTVAFSPKLHGSTRASVAPARRQLPHHSVVEQEKRQQEAHKRLAQSQFKPRVTQPKEFELRTSARGSQYQNQLMEQLQKDLEREAAAREVKVAPLPDLKKAFQPVIVHKEATEPVPFHLRSVARHDDAQSSFQQELEMEQERLRKEQFKARPLPKTTFEHKEIEKPADRPPLKALPITLTTDVRAQKRREFDMNIQSKMAEIEKMQQSMDKLKFQQESEMLRELRKKSIAEGGLCFKAAPILEKDPYPTVFHAAKPLTEPKSPALRTSVGRHSASTTGKSFGSSNRAGAVTNTGGKLGAAMRVI